MGMYECTCVDRAEAAAAALVMYSRKIRLRTLFQHRHVSTLPDAVVHIPTYSQANVVTFVAFRHIDKGASQH